ncbi:MAG: hypothetical protein AB1715_05605, partial [Acidobacteriota bacterium]
MRLNRPIYFGIGLILVLAFLSSGMSAQQPPQKKSPAEPAVSAQAQAQAQVPSSPPPSPAAEKPFSVTRHTITVGGRSVAYTASVGTIMVNKPDEKPGAHVFFMAYTQDGVK